METSLTLLLKPEEQTMRAFRLLFFEERTPEFREFGGASLELSKNHCQNRPDAGMLGPLKSWT